MNALMIQETKEGHKPSKPALSKRQESLITAAQAGALSGAALSFLLQTPQFKEDSDVDGWGMVKNTILGAIIGAGVGLAATSADYYLLHESRQKKLHGKIRAKLAELEVDYSALLISYKNIFESYMDGYAIESEIYNLAFETTKAKREIQTLEAERVKLEDAFDRASEDLSKLFGVANKEAIQSASQIKAAISAELNSCKEAINGMNTLIADETKSLSDIEKRYFITLGNRRSRAYFEKVFIKGVAMDITILKEMLSDTKGRVMFQRDLLKKVANHHQLLTLAYEQSVEEMDTHRDKATSGFSKTKRGFKGRGGVDMTYSGAPFYKLFFIASDLKQMEKGDKNEFSTIVQGAISDFEENRDKGDWLVKRNYSDIDLFASIFSREDAQMLIESLQKVNPELTSLEDVNEVQKAYRKFVSMNHSDISDRPDDEAIAKVSTLIKRYKRYIREKEDLGGNNGTSD